MSGQVNHKGPRADGLGILCRAMVWWQAWQICPATLTLRRGEQDLAERHAAQTVDLPSKCRMALLSFAILGEMHMMRELLECACAEQRCGGRPGRSVQQV